MKAHCGMSWAAWGFLLAAMVAHGQSARPGVGAIPYTEPSGTGVTFRTWAPNATTVSVAGNFNGWGTTALVQDPGTPWNGYWSVDSSRARTGDRYKFVVNGSYRRDPRGRRVVNSDGDSIVYDPGTFQWSQAALDFNRIWRNDLVIYEMHIGTYNAESWLPSTFDQCIENLDHIKSMGFSAVKLMPVNEFPGDRSWGYNPTDLYAIESAFGGPEAFKRFIQACHENGIAVILDVVHNHYGPTDLDMWRYDGWYLNNLGGIYFYNDHRAQTDWGHTRPDFGRPEVRDFIQDQIRMFLEDYRLDGFRWDSVFNIRYHSGGTWNPQGNQLLQEVNSMMINEFGYAFRIAEDHAFDTDVGFEAQWDPQFLNDIRWLAVAGSDADRNMHTLAWHLSNRGFDRVVYVESHDTCGDLNDGKYRLPYDIHSSEPEGYWAKKRALLANTIALVSPGIPMIFAGSEMHEWWRFSNNQALRWSLTNQNAGIVRAYTDLIHLRRNFGGISGGLKQPGNVNVHHVNNSAKVVGKIRWDQGGQTDDLVIVINCSASAYPSYEMGFPSDGTWYCLYNSDSQSYDSLFGGVGPEIGGSIVVAGGSAPLALGAYSMQIYSKSRPAESAVVQFDPPAPDGCGTTLTITYEPHDGPLADATSVIAFIGRNNWLTPSDFPMTATADGWQLDYEIPELTYEINLSFHDGEDIWDNNGGANWTVAVLNCGDLPAETTWSPYVPQGCIPVQITYRPNGGPLMGATNLNLHLGRNGWQDVFQPAMTEVGPNEWTYVFDIPDDTWELNFVFFFQDGPGELDREWDNNNGRNWRILVSGCVHAEQPYLIATNPPAYSTVAGSVTQQSVRGRARLLTGHLTWSNSLTGASGFGNYSTNWHFPALPLGEGLNLIRISGTNSAINPNHGAGDSPTHAAYNAAWPNGSNGGQGFQPWILNAHGNASASMASNEAPLTLGPRAWALQAQDGGFVQAIRPFVASLHPGDVVSFVFENGGIDGGFENSSIGVAFQNRFNQRLTEFRFDGGTTNFLINDTELRNTGMPWSNTPKTCTLEILTPLTYRLTVNGQSFEGELAENSEVLISRIRFWNWNAGGGNERKLYVGDISVTGDPLPVQTYSSEIAVLRPTTAWRRVLDLWTTPTGFIAAMNSVEGLNGNIWVADTVTNGGWNWTLLPAEAYTFSDQNVILTPPPHPRLQVFSIGKPGGH